MRVKEESEKTQLKTKLSPITSWQIEEGKVKAVTNFLFLGSEVIADGDWSLDIRRQLLLGMKVMTNLKSALKSKDITLLTKISVVKAIFFPVVSCDTWTLKKAECWRIDAFELWYWRRLLRVPYSKDIKPVNLKGNQPWILIGRTDGEGEAPILSPADVNSQLIGKDPDAGKDRKQKEKKETEDKMIGWHHRCNGNELGQTSGNGEGQGGLACFSPWGHKESDLT